MAEKEEDIKWFERLKQFLQFEPQNKEELIHFLRDVQTKAQIDSETLAMIEGVIILTQMKARDIMLPKQQMICVPLEAGLKEIVQLVAASGHSRFPVVEAGKDEIVGILHAKDLLRFLEPEFDLMDIAREVIFVPESKRLNSLLSEFRNTRNHMAIVVDEYGSTSGFVTIEDIIEQITGDIEDEFDIDEEAYIKMHEENHYMVKAHMPIDEFNEQLHSHLSKEHYDTLGGILMANFGYLPKRGETITLENIEFKIVNADGRRIKLIECFDKRK